MTKLIVVFGATGTQGGSVVASILQHPILSQQFKIRGITRDPSKPEALALQAKGVDVVKADLLDRNSLQQVLKGAHTVFAVTNYWDKDSLSKKVEVTQGKNIADIAKEAGVKHLIWSSLPNVTKLTNGKLINVPHFDGKAEVAEYIKTIGVPATFLEVGFYMSNLKTSINKGEDGVYALAMPIPGNTGIPLFNAGSDTGKFVTAIISKYDAQPLGKRILGATSYSTPDEILQTFTEATGHATNYVQISEEVFKSFFPEFMALEMLENMHLIRDWEYYGPGAQEALKESLQILDTKPSSLKEYFENSGPW